ncbi:MAG TPA: class E sortase [Nocardioidaceae bacterium]|nr:class E sortase [Nocardioidaceae bacterium]
MSQDTGAPPADGTVDEQPTGPAGKQRRKRGVSFWLGLMLVLGGLGMLGHVAWQMYGTNIVSRQTQERLVQDLEQEWSVAPGTTVEGKPAEPADVPLGNASALIRIPAFGDDYVVPVLEGIGDEELSSGYGHFPDSADPGERGNYALAAHRVTHGEPLRDMPELRPGDEVVVETRKAVYTYVLDTNPNDLIVTFEDIWVVDPLPTNPGGGVQPEQRPGQKLITLTTCSELFHTDNRMIAFGHLVDTEKKSAAAAG